jgi:hypothetical protein
MIGFLFIGHPQVADMAIIFSKLNSTRNTIVSKSGGNVNKKYS